MQAQYVVQKALSTANGTLAPGTVIDPAGWRNLPQLIDQRYVRLVTETDTEVEAKATAKRGRKAQREGN
jgi:hypothetical protein